MDIEIPAPLVHALRDCFRTEEPTLDELRDVLATIVIVWNGGSNGAPRTCEHFARDLKGFLHKEIVRLRVVNALKEAGASGDLKALARELVEADLEKIGEIMRYVPGVIGVLQALGRLK